VILTAEGLAHPVWRLEEIFLRCLDELASSHRVRVAYYVRPQHATLEAAWRQWGFRSGKPPSEYLRHRARTLHYWETYEGVIARAPRISFEPRPFRGDLLIGGSVVSDFARHFLELEDDATGADQTWSNRGLPLEVANLLQAAPEGLLSDGVHDNAGLAIVKDLIRDLDPPEDGDVETSRAVLQAFCHATYEAGNQQLSAALGWGAREFVPSPPAETGTGAEASLERIDELWRPKASAVERELLWRALSSTLTQGPKRVRRRRFSASPRIRDRRVFLDLELGVGRREEARRSPSRRWIGPLKSAVTRLARG
jgi:hypothetical protein